MFRLLSLGAFALSTSLAGCNPPPPQPFVPHLVCNVETLSSQRASYKKQADIVRDEAGSLGEVGDVFVKRLRDFDMELDGKYSAVTSSCRAFTLCMQANGYQEGRCQGTLIRWQSADDGFSRLATDLREIEAGVDRARISAARPRQPQGPRVNPNEPCVDNVAGVFSKCPKYD